MSVRNIAFGLLVLTSIGMTQDLPPEVLLLSRIKLHTREQLSHVPNYTCLATINRFHKATARDEMKPLDTVRLEVIYSDHGEWYGVPGDRNLGERNPSKFVGSGLMGSGVFATSLSNILSGSRFTYRGKESKEGRMAEKYDFLFPRQPIAFQINMVGGSGTVGERGSIWFDAESLDVIRFEAHADDIPRYLPLAEQDTLVSYARTQIGTRENPTYALLAQRADLRLLNNEGADSLDHFEFTNCRAYSAESTISFNEEAPVVTTKLAVRPQAESDSLPALLRVVIKLVTPISSSDPVGKMIEARVSGALSHKGKVVIPDGALVRGRIRRLEHYQTRTAVLFADFVVGLEFTEVETAAGRAPFYADILKMDESAVIQPKLGERVSTGTITVTLPELPGVASFFVKGATFTIPAGFGTVWRTRGPIRGQ